MRIKLIANPAAGRRVRARIAAACRLLAREGTEVVLHETRGPGDAERAAAACRDGGWDRIVVAGGDGTLNEVINGLAPARIPLAFLPLGTTNVCAHELGLPRRLRDACRVALDGEPRPVSLGRVNGRAFLLMAGIGFDAAVVEAVPSRLKRRCGQGAYLLTALRLLPSANRAPFSVDCDGERHPAQAAIVSNARRYGGPFVITPAASLSAPRLDLCLLQRGGPLPLLRLALNVLRGRPAATPGTRFLTATQLAIPEPGLPIQVDGDFLGHTPARIELAGGELLLVHPGTEVTR